MDFTTLAGHLAHVLLPLFAGAFLALATYVVHKLAQQFHIDQIAGTNELIDNAIRKGIDYADSWAARQALRPVGDAKMAVALNLIEDILGDPVFRTYGADHIQRLVESYLQRDQMSAPPQTVTQSNSQVFIKSDAAASGTIQ